METISPGLYNINIGMKNMVSVIDTAGNRDSKVFYLSTPAKIKGKQDMLLFLYNKMTQFLAILHCHLSILYCNQIFISLKFISKRRVIYTTGAL